MKYYLLILLLIFSSYLPAQPGLESRYHRPRPDDHLIKQQVEYKSPGRSGSNILWDFSEQKAVNDNYPVIYSGYGDSLLIRREKRTLFKYVHRNDTLLGVGSENQTTLLHYHQPEVSLVYPVKYRDSLQCYYHGTGDYCEKISLTNSGKFSYHADAYGLIILPGGDILENVLRVHCIRQGVEKRRSNYSDLIIDSICRPDSIEYHLSTDSTWLQTDTYSFYAEGYRYPVFETFENTLYQNGKYITAGSTAFYYPPGEQYYALENDPENQEKREALKEKELKKHKAIESKNNANNKELGTNDTKINYSISFNKKENSLLLDYELYEDAEVAVLLYDMQGRLLEEYSKTRQPAGAYIQTIFLDEQTRGNYLLRIEIDNEVIGEKIVLK